MKKFQQKSKPHIKEVILDSGPLLIYLCLNYIRNKEIKNKEKLLFQAYDKAKHIPNVIDQFESYFNNINKIYTSSHIIGELKGLVKSRLKEINEDDFWQHSIEFLNRINFFEETIKLIELSNDNKFKNLIYKIGFVDSGLLKLADDKKVNIISTDHRTLLKEAEKKNIGVLILLDDIFS